MKNICGAAYADLGHYDEALEKYHAALAISPYFAVAHNNRGNTLRSQGELDAAVEAYKAAIQANPEFFEFLKGTEIFDEAVSKYTQSDRSEFLFNILTKLVKLKISSLGFISSPK